MKNCVTAKIVCLRPVEPDCVCVCWLSSDEPPAGAV